MSPLEKIYLEALGLEDDPRPKMRLVYTRAFEDISDDPYEDAAKRLAARRSRFEEWRINIGRYRRRYGVSY